MRVRVTVVVVSVCVCVCLSVCHTLHPRDGRLSALESYMNMKNATFSLVYNFLIFDSASKKSQAIILGYLCVSCIIISIKKVCMKL